jgi:hypothetical protein
MSIETVNGYVCTNCSEAALAKRGIDPHRPAVEAEPAQSNAFAAQDDQRPRATLAYSQQFDKLA